MTDRELLEAAAKAAGYSGILNFNNEYGVMEPRGGGVSTLRQWNPLRDDGDALRLASKVGIDLTFLDNEVIADVPNPSCDRCIEQVWRSSEMEMATRRAIVRAAAAIGKVA